MSRWKASAIHLALSVLVIGTLAALMLWRWYPPALVEVTGADTVLPLIAGVDVVMGPLLTLVVFKHGKKSLKFDLAVIALLQIAAMVYGLHTAWITRPVFLVASDSRLTLVIANEFSEQVLRDAPPQYARLPVLGPQTVGQKPPAPGDEGLMAVAGPRLPSQFVPYPQVAPRLARNAIPLDALDTLLDAGEKARLDKAVKATGRERKDLGAVAVHSIRGKATMLLDRSTGTLLKPVPIHLPSSDSMQERRAVPPAPKRP